MNNFPSIRIEVPNLAGPTSEWMSQASANKDATHGKAQAHSLPIPKKLSLHVAMTAGETTHVVVGNPGMQMDYFVQGQCLLEIATIINDAKAGEVGISARLWSMLGSILDVSRCEARRSEGVIILASNQLRLFTDVLATEAPRKSSVLRPREDEFDDGVETFWTAGNGRDKDGEEELLERFSNQSFVYKINKVHYQAAFKGSELDGNGKTFNSDRN
ncbi:hypothetical protein HK101_004474 [Irineochytrium annulatum]|nr:hypothetical protein HK101_004474 [Irineochytrium annulatum]